MTFGGNSRVEMQNIPYHTDVHFSQQHQYRQQHQEQQRHHQQQHQHPDQQHLQQHLQQQQDHQQVDQAHYQQQHPTAFSSLTSDIIPTTFRPSHIVTSSPPPVSGTSTAPPAATRHHDTSTTSSLTSSAISSFSARLQAKVASLLFSGNSQSEGGGGEVASSSGGGGVSCGRRSLEEVVVGEKEGGEAVEDGVMGGGVVRCDKIVDHVSFMESGNREVEICRAFGGGGHLEDEMPEEEMEEDMDRKLAMEESARWREEKENQYQELALLYHLWYQKRGQVNKTLEHIQRLLQIMGRTSKDIEMVTQRQTTGEVNNEQQEGEEHTTDAICVEAKEWLLKFTQTGADKSQQGIEEEEEDQTEEHGSSIQTCDTTTTTAIIGSSSSSGGDVITEPPLPPAVVPVVSDLSDSGCQQIPSSPSSSQEDIPTLSQHGEEEGKEDDGLLLLDGMLDSFISVYGDGVDDIAGYVPTTTISDAEGGGHNNNNSLAVCDGAEVSNNQTDDSATNNTPSTPSVGVRSIVATVPFCSPLIARPQLLPSTSQLCHSVGLQSCLSAELLSYCLRVTN
eukprot:GHVS01093884.1.p1 GENE.GHVS01093884.1~~GHVS01093884.1.p1  ORF type:complete len:563 (+),score=213.93 GHVS01093884.1:374-2062(+)